MYRMYECREGMDAEERPARLVGLKPQPGHPSATAPGVALPPASRHSWPAALGHVSLTSRLLRLPSAKPDLPHIFLRRSATKNASAAAPAAIANVSPGPSVSPGRSEGTT